MCKKSRFFSHRMESNNFSRWQHSMHTQTKFSRFSWAHRYGNTERVLCVGKIEKDVKRKCIFFLFSFSFSICLRSPHEIQYARNFISIFFYLISLFVLHSHSYISISLNGAHTIVVPMNIFTSSSIPFNRANSDSVNQFSVHTKKYKSFEFS